MLGDTSTMSLTRRVFVAVLIAFAHAQAVQAFTCVSDPSACAAGEWNLAISEQCKKCPAYSRSPEGSEYITECSCDTGIDIHRAVVPRPRVATVAPA